MSEGPIETGRELMNNEVSLVMFDMNVAPNLVVRQVVFKSLARLCLSRRPVKSWPLRMRTCGTTFFDMEAAMQSGCAWSK